MEKISFNLDIILSNDKIHPKTYEFGKEYFDIKKVSSCQANKIGEEIHVNAVCNGYNLTFNIIDDELNKTHCQCFTGSKGVICKHIVATLLYVDKNYNVNKNHFLNLDVSSYFDFLSSNNLFEILKIFNQLLKNKHNFKFFEIALKFKNINVYINDQFSNFELSQWKAFSSFLDKLIKTNKSNEQLVYLQEHIKHTNKILEVLFEISPNRYHNFFISDAEIDVIFDAFTKAIDKGYKWIYFIDSKNNSLLPIKKTLSLNEKIPFEFSSHLTNVGFVISSNLKLIEILTSWKKTYIIYSTNNLDAYLSIFNFIDENDTKCIKDIFLPIKNSKILNNKINRITSSHFLKAVDIKNNNLKMEIFFRMAKDQKGIEVEFSKNSISYLSFLKTFKEIINELDNENKIIFYELSALLDFYKKIQEFENSSLIYCHIEENIKLIFSNQKENIEFKFSLQDDKIKFETFIKNMKFDLNNLKGQISKSSKKRMNFLKLDNEFISYDNISINDYQNNLDILALNKSKRQQIDNNKIFYIASKFKEKEFIDFVNKFNKQTVDLNLDEEIMLKAKPFQLIGIKWIKKMLNYSGGCILADEMGLGKTFQTIAYINDFVKNNKQPILIITPYSLIQNWKSEFKKFDPTKNIIEITGNNLQRQTIIKNIKPNNIYISNYHKFINDTNYYHDKHFGLVVLDEGQYIKNKTTKWSKNIKNILADKRLILTGTPMENNIIDIWSLFEFILPHYLPDIKIFKKLFNQNDKNSINELAFLIKPFILQRKKIDELPDLPFKFKNDIFIKMSEQEEEIYLKLFETLKQDIKLFFNSKSSTRNKVKMNIIGIITKLRMFCCDPLLLSFNNVKRSKLDYCLSLVKKLKTNPENKIVIFSSFTSLLDNLKELLIENNFSCLVLTGKNNQKERKLIIDNFNKLQDKILLVSLKVGGVGINLNTANIVIHFNPWWNDSVEDQATDRLHRIGQNKEVNVFNLILQNSIEEKILKIKNIKGEIIDSTISSASYLELFKLINNNEK